MSFNGGRMASSRNLTNPPCLIDSFLERIFMQKYEPIITSIGHIWGRDAIHLDSIHLSYSENSLELQGEFNTVLCSELKRNSDGWVSYSLKFNGVLGLTMIELDLADDHGTSSFDVVVESEWIN